MEAPSRSRHSRPQQSTPEAPGTSDAAPGALPLEAAPEADGIEALDVCPKCGAPLRGDDTVLCLLHVVEPVPPMYYAGDVTSRFELDGELRARIDTTLRDWSGDLQHAQPMIAEGNPAVETARVADDIEADLVVISTRGRTGLDRLLVGSVTQRVCQIATVPVLAVR